MKKEVVWALFDSGGGAYQRTIYKYFSDVYEVYPVGIDVEGKHNNFIQCDLGDISELFGRRELFNTLDRLPNPDIILASPPCESWSTASAMRPNGNSGNACWVSTVKEPRFEIRSKKDLDDHASQVPNQKKHYWKALYSRLNGEACAYNVVRIIERYKPRYWVIENPQTSRIWRYYESICDFHGYKNVAHYCDYDPNFSKKPTIFYSNVELRLSKGKIISKKTWNDVSRNYNERSDIPLELIKDILNQIQSTTELQNQLNLFEFCQMESFVKKH